MYIRTYRLWSVPQGRASTFTDNADLCAMILTYPRRGLRMCIYQVVCTYIHYDECVCTYLHTVHLFALCYLCLPLICIRTLLFVSVAYVCLDDLLVFVVSCPCHVQCVTGWQAVQQTCPPGHHRPRPAPPRGATAVLRWGGYGGGHYCSGNGEPCGVQVSGRRAGWIGRTEEKGRKGEILSLFGVCVKRWQLES